MMSAANCTGLPLADLSGGASQCSWGCELEVFAGFLVYVLIASCCLLLLGGQRPAPVPLYALQKSGKGEVPELLSMPGAEVAAAPISCAPRRSAKAEAAAARLVGLQASLDAAMAQLAAERGAREEAERASAAQAAELMDLRLQLYTTQNHADSLAVVNKGLQEELDTVQSELPAKDVAYHQLQAAFYRLQHMYVTGRGLAAAAAATASAAPRRQAQRAVAVHAGALAGAARLERTS